MVYRDLAWYAGSKRALSGPAETATIEAFQLSHIAEAITICIFVSLSYRGLIVVFVLSNFIFCIAPRFDRVRWGDWLGLAFCRERSGTLV
jgi:hypothetical protein